MAGFTIEVKPVPVSESIDNMRCRATVISPEGKIVYSFDDWGAEIDNVTGKDVNGDGEPDAVLVAFSGGAHCCWTYHIISLGKRPGLIRDFENRAPASFSDLRGNGQIEIVIRDGTFDGGLGLAHAFSVFPLLIVQLQGSEFRDVSSDFWPIYQKEIRKQRARLLDGQMEEFLHRDSHVDNDAVDDPYVKSAILQIILDYLYGGRHEQAKRFLTRWWPKESREETWSEITQGYCSGLREDLGLEQRSPCTSK